MKPEYGKLIRKITVKSLKREKFTIEVKKIALNTSDDKIIQSINSIEAYAYETSKHLVCKKKIKCNNITKNTKLFNFDEITREKNIAQIGHQFLIINSECQ